MSFNTFHPGFCATHETFQRRLQLNPLYDYATRNWGHHAREASMVEPLIINFLESQTKINAASKAMIGSKQDLRRERNVLAQMTGLHIAAYSGLRGVTADLLKGRSHLDLTDSDRRTPLLWSAGNRRETVVELLLNTHRGNTDLKDGCGWTPLLWAARDGHESVILKLWFCMQREQ
jgi:hypothetical protein